MRSPDRKINNRGVGGSQPDLSKVDDAQITFRKRKERDFESEDNKEMSEFRKDLMRTMVEMGKTQKDTLCQIRETVDEIKNEIKTMKVTIENVLQEQNVIKTEIAELKINSTKNNEKICGIESEINILKNSSCSSSAVLPPLHDTQEEILSEYHERRVREKNVIIVGIAELEASDDVNEKKAHDKCEVLKTLRAIDMQCPDPVNIMRLGKFMPGKSRYIRVSFVLQSTVLDILRKQPKSSDKEGVSVTHAVRIFSDKTPSQQKYFKTLKDELSLRKNNGETDLSIKYVKGIPKIIKNIPKNQE